ncbi:SRPBCC domain-containing protein [Acinetobacter rathckeae]|uniref:SRPBCC domain-containing protein n=1 Tax=Acinetobacter rathckeae TaxID=2605272 RepID=UPI0018A300DB|nr:SRPBCC domain-containing protein [Acinetobacter rathckeae]MBF7688629.1 SRPBCC domain-containing protein [Acinetobacter rathckeae]MBF7695875.1 SRPBCC domain-containing protein [Acinetobacter rathckeae]
MKFEINTEVRIKATLDQVWAVLMDFEHYKAWNPFIYDVVGNMSEGGLIRVTLHDDSAHKMSFKAIVLAHDTNKQFTWLGRLWMKGIFDGEHSFVLEQVSEDTVKLTQSEMFRGVLVRPFLKTLQHKTTQNFQKMNDALKKKVEGL